MELNLANFGLLTLGIAILVVAACIFWLVCAYIEYRFDIKKRNMEYMHKKGLVRYATREFKGMYKGMSEETIKLINKNLFEMDH